MTWTRSAPRSGAWGPVRRTALAKIVVMGAAGIFGLINTRLITSHFGADAYAQYGLLASFPNLMPFTDLGIGAVILNTVAGSSDLRHDMIVRRTLTTAIRVLLGSALLIATTGIVLGLLGAWPTLLGAKLMDGGGATASFCLLVYAAALPLSVGQRVVVGMGRTATQVISQGVVSPALTCMLLVVVIARIDAGNAVSGLSYVANTLVSIICVVVAWRATRPLLAGALRDVPRLHRVRGVKIIDTAGPSLVQALVIPIAFQLFNMLTQTVTATGMAMWPHFAKARADGRVESPFGAAAAFAASGGALGVCLAAVAPWAAPLLSKGQIVLPTALLVANVANVVVEAAKQPLGMYMTDPRGLRAQMLPVLIVVPANLALSWVLIAPLGAAGPLAGSVITVIVCQLVPYALWVAHDLRRRRAKEAGDGLEHPEAAPRESHESLDEDPGEAVLAAARTGAGGPTSTPAGGNGRTVVLDGEPAVGPGGAGPRASDPRAASDDTESPDPPFPTQPER